VIRVAWLHPIVREHLFACVARASFMLKGKYFYEVDFFDDKGHEADDLRQVSDFIANIVVK
jgi:hypothetical protein